MVSKYEMKKYIKENPDKFPYVYNEEEDAIYSTDGKYMSSLDTFLDIYRKHTGQSFECLYDDHASLECVLRCTECGTVIFSYDDERYDDNLKCPTCTDYKTYFKFWTKDEIESDREKQNTINWFKEMTEYRIEQYKRIKRRNGKQDWEIAKKEFRGKKRYLQFILECDDITESYFKGLRLDIRCGKKDSNIGGYTVNKFYTIPLSWSRFYLQFIYKHLGKCHPDFRSKWYIGKAVEKKTDSKKK